MTIIKVLDKGDITLKDGLDITPDEMLHDMMSGTLYRTASPLAGICDDLLQSVSKEYDNVFILSLPKSVSGTYNQWRMLASDYNNVYVYDSPGIGKITEWIINDLQNIQSLNKQKVDEYFEKMYDKYKICVIANELKYMARGGRVSNAKALIAKLLKIKVVVGLTTEGLKLFGKAIKEISLVKTVIDFFKQYGINPDEVEKVALFTSDCEKTKFDVSSMIKAVKSQFPKSKIESSFLPCVISAHVGPNYLAIAVKAK